LARYDLLSLQGNAVQDESASCLLRRSQQAFPLTSPHKFDIASSCGA